MGQSPQLDHATQIGLFRTMVQIRAFEKAVLSVLRTALVDSSDPDRSLHSELRLSAGREPVAAAVCAHLEAADALTAAHRPHHLAIAHGVDLRKLACEALGPPVDDRRHRWHLFDPDTQFTSSASIAEGYPPALGRAFAFQQRDSGRVAVAVTDKEAAHQDGFREALDLAKLWSLPLVFVVEDDDWAGESPRSLPSSEVAAVQPSTDYGVAAERIEGNAVELIFEAAGRSVGRARTGGGPTVLEVHTARLWRHPDGRLPEFVEDLVGVVGADPIETYGQELVKAGLIEPSGVEQISEEEDVKVEAAIAYALGDDDPDTNGHCPTCERKAAT